MEGGYDFPFEEEFVKEILQTYTHERMRNDLKNDVVDRAMGCLFGSFIGDALGAYLEFAKEKDYDKLMTEGTDESSKLWTCLVKGFSKSSQAKSPMTPKWPSTC